MDFVPRFLATGIGSMPFDDPDHAVDLSLRCFSEAPFWPQLPRLGYREQMVPQYAGKLPRVIVDLVGERLCVDTSGDFSNELAEFYEACMLAMESGEGDYSFQSISPDFSQGILNVGEPMATPIIKKLRGQLDRSKIVILDSPPGTSCPVIETVRESDFCILVTEPTPFGLHDLKLAVATVRELHLPFGVIINCAGNGDDAVETYCHEQDIPLLMKIPWDRRIAEGYSRGEPVVAITPELKKQFQDLYAKITSTVKGTA